MVAEALIVGAISDLIAQMAVVGAHDIGIVVFVGRLFAADVLLGNPDAESDGLGLEVLMIARRPVGAPAAPQPRLVGEFHRLFHVDDACGEEVILHILIEEYVDISAAAACILRVADGHRDGRLVGVGLPVLVDYLDDGAQRSVGDDALRAAADGIDHRGLLSVPSTEGTESEGVAHPEHIVTIAFGLLLFRGVELRLLQFEALLELAVEVERLALVEARFRSRRHDGAGCYRSWHSRHGP